jgi:hypothetical protein
MSVPMLCAGVPQQLFGAEKTPHGFPGGVLFL